MSSVCVVFCGRLRSVNFIECVIQAGGQGEQINRARSGFTVSRGCVGYLRVRELQVQQVGPELALACDRVLMVVCCGGYELVGSDVLCVSRVWLC